jgi:hypothetical protein
MKLSDLFLGAALGIGAIMVVEEVVAACQHYFAKDEFDYTITVIEDADPEEVVGIMEWIEQNSPGIGHG